MYRPSVHVYSDLGGGRVKADDVDDDDEKTRGLSSRMKFRKGRYFVC